MDVRIAGAGMTRFGKSDLDLVGLVREAAGRAMADSGIDDFDHVFYGVQNPEAFTGNANVATFLSTGLGLRHTAATRVESAPSSGSSALECAYFAVKSGEARHVLVVGAEKMTHLETGEVSRTLSLMMDASERKYGLTMPALASLAARSYMSRFGVTREDLDLVPIKAHKHGALNPYAQFQRAITADEVRKSPMVADPLRVYDCAPISDGAAALVLSAARGPVKITGTGHATDDYSLAARHYEDATVSFRASTLAAQRAFGKSGVAAKDVDVVEMHDAFSILEFMNPVDLGLLKRGEEVAALKKGETSLGGRLPLNPSGGVKARGHPLGATGVAMAVEIYWQLSRQAGRHQVDGCRVGMTHNIGGFGNNNVVTIMEAVH